VDQHEDRRERDPNHDKYRVVIDIIAIKQ